MSCATLIGPMVADRAGGFPVEAVRDLLGVARALYASAREAGASTRELHAIQRVGAELSRSLQLAGIARPGTEAYDAAWERAEAATRRLATLVDGMAPAAPLVAAARARVLGDAPVPRRKRDER